MPIYEYRCTACGHQLEVLQKFSATAPQICPNCNGSTLQKLISAVSFRLKGSGWYETDFKDSRKKNLHATEDEASPSTVSTNTPSDGTNKDSAATSKDSATTSKSTSEVASTNSPTAASKISPTSAA